jgi:hypothetical protein
VAEVPAQDEPQLQADMYSGNAGEEGRVRGAGHELLRCLTRPSASVLVLHNIDYLPRTLASVRRRLLPHGVIIATASSRGRSAGATLQAVILRGRVRNGLWPEAEKLAETLIKSRDAEDCRVRTQGDEALLPHFGVLRALRESLPRPRHPSPWLPTWNIGRG